MGHTLLPAASCAVPTVHPHIRGAYLFAVTLTGKQGGSSPHTWGIQLLGIRLFRGKRFIPTYVGHTFHVRWHVHSLPVHPHIRGAYAGADRDRVQRRGSSPHTWGIRRPGRCRGRQFRFIPTYVGHTWASSASTQGLSVHPHLRGAYVGRIHFHQLQVGSSPPTWGIRRIFGTMSSGSGSSPHTWGILQGWVDSPME